MELEIAGRTRSEFFNNKLAAYRANPSLYMLDRKMELFERYCPGIPKYVVAVDPNRVEFRVDSSGVMDELNKVGYTEKKKNTEKPKR